MKLTSEIEEGSRVRVRIDREGRHLKSYTGTVKYWRKDGQLAIEDTSGKMRFCSPDNAKLIKQ